MHKLITLLLIGTLTLGSLYGCHSLLESKEAQQDNASGSLPSMPPTFPQTVIPVPTPTATPGPPEGYVISFADEFDVNGTPDPSVWTFEQGPWPYNDELETYTSDNAFIQDGLLIIEARKEEREGRSYTSARLNTSGKLEVTYGYIEVRAAVPTGRGTWSAIWLMPSDTSYGGYLSSGEIDMMEHVGYKPDTVYASLHTAENNSVKGNAIMGRTKLQNTGDFHTYGLLWEENVIRIYVDGLEYLSYQRPPDADSRIWPFDLPFHLICNVAIGGSWGGKEGVDETAFPQSMRVDYLRYYVRSTPFLPN